MRNLQEKLACIRDVVFSLRCTDHSALEYSPTYQQKFQEACADLAIELHSCVLAEAVSRSVAVSLKHGDIEEAIACLDPNDETNTLGIWLLKSYEDQMKEAQGRAACNTVACFSHSTRTSTTWTWRSWRILRASYMPW